MNRCTPVPIISQKAWKPDYGIETNIVVMFLNIAVFCQKAWKPDYGIETALA